MTDRDITGDIKRSSLGRLPALLGIDEGSMKELADRVTQFNQSQTDETRQRKALEKLAVLFGQSILIETPSRKSERRRELAALELMAAAQAAPYEELRQTQAYKRLILQLGAQKPETANPTRETQGETRD